MIKELYHSTIEKELTTIPLDSILLDDWNAAVELCKERIKSGTSNKAYIYTILVTIPRETGRRKLSAKYDCFYWKSTTELIPDEKYELIDIDTEPKKVDL